MPTQAPSLPVLDLLKLDQPQWAYFLDLIERREQQGATDTARRRHERHAYLEFTQLGLVVETSRKDRKMFLVRTYDLSAGGVGLLHGQYVSAGTNVHIMMLHRTQGRVIVSGTVRRCELLEGHVHTLGVQFTEPVDPSDYLLIGA